MYRQIFLFALLSSQALFGREVPGKTHLFPNQEIKYAHQRASSEFSFNGNQLNIGKLYHGDKLLTVNLDLSLINEILIIKEIPNLRGDLINAYDDDDRKFITQLHIRFNFKKPVFAQDIKSNEKIELNEIIFSYDFKLNRDQDIKILEEDYRSIDRLQLPMQLKALTLLDLSSKLSKFDKEMFQYGVALEYHEISHLIKTILRNKNSKSFQSETNTSSTLIWQSLTDVLRESRHLDLVRSSRIRIHGGTRSHQRWNELKLKKLDSNPSLVEKNLEIRNLDQYLPEFRFYSLKNEACLKFEEKLKLNGCLGRSAYEESQINELFEKLELLYKDRLLLKHDYVHKGFEDEIDNLMRNILKVDNELIAQGTAISKARRIKIWGRFLRVISYNKNYDEIRFFEEGAFHKEYSPFFVKRLISILLRTDKEILEENGVDLELIKEIKTQFIDTDLELLGNDLGNGLVNVLGQIFKKRDWVPYIRVASNFRDNHLTKYRDRVFKDLFHPNGMKPGDILVEKDLQANTDVLIPGYWIHAAIYLGSIKDMKKMGIWDDPRIDVIKYEIEKYRSSEDRQYYLNDVWKNKLSFEDIPWFFESDRPGVGVHPFIKFLKTDGMAVLRPTQNWELQQIKNIFYRANERMYFMYDYNHNVRNKFTVSCSKVVLKVFDQITFPVSHNLGYVSVSPDQIAQPVSRDPSRPELGELKLIMFLDAYQEGKKVFDHSDPKTFGVYQQYLKASGAL